MKKFTLEQQNTQLNFLLATVLKCGTLDIYPLINLVELADRNYLDYEDNLLDVVEQVHQIPDNLNNWLYITVAEALAEQLTEKYAPEEDWEESFQIWAEGIGSSIDYTGNNQKIKDILEEL